MVKKNEQIKRIEGEKEIHASKDADAYGYRPKRLLENRALRKAFYL